MRWKRLLFMALIAWGAYHHWQNREVKYGPGVVAPDIPQQTRSTEKYLDYHGYRLIPLADFALQARILSVKSYHLDRESDLAPVDVALGWGRMSDETVLSQIDISQDGRFYFWRTEHFPIPREEIETHSANMHMIPATPHIAETLDTLRKGQIIKLSGYLIEATAPDGWHWRSSLTRDDTGAGACEVIFVKSLSVQ